MKTYAIAYAGTLISFLVIDAIWLGVVAKSFYQEQLGDMMLPSPNLSVAAVFYVFFALTIVDLVWGTVLTAAASAGGYAAARTVG